MAAENGITRTFATSVAEVLFQPLSVRAATELSEQGRIISTDCIGVAAPGLRSRREQSHTSGFLEEFSAA